ncbi:MAG: hypothetical protein H0W88_08130 [Parachlamydiaceae bacterium]|nr:hypothetical protein [Parachlamydiaceae bacterium]
MKHKNMTFSIPEDLKINLQSHISKRGMSRFVSNAIRKALFDDEVNKERELDAAYEAANQDTDRLDTLRDWNMLDDVSDLIDDEEDWNWLKTSNEKGKKLKHG